MLYHLCYASTQTRPMQGDDFVDILQTAYRTNAEHDVTGLLLHRIDSFLQVLEGRQADVLDVYHRICTDDRHRDIKLLFEGPTEAREFADWRMAFVNLTDVDIRELPAFSDFLISETEPRRFLEDLTRTKRLLLLFRSMQ